MKIILADINIILTSMDINDILVETKIILIENRRKGGNMMESGKIRGRRANFSMVSNSLLQDSHVSLKAKGLYSVIQSYITIPDFTLYKSFLMRTCKEGTKAFEAAWTELKSTGYLAQYKLKDDRGKFVYEYELLDIPEPHPQNGGMGNYTPHPHFVGMEKVGIRNVDMQNGGCINNTLQNNTVQNNTNQIISFDDTMRQIGYSKESLTDEVENIITLMTEVYNMADSSLIRINQQNVSAEVVKERFKKIRYEHIDYILVVLNDFTGSIRNIRNFMLTTIFNAVSTSDIYFKQRVQHDMYEKGDKTWKVVK